MINGRERKDYAQWIDKVISECRSQTKIISFGLSTGAVIEDSRYSRTTEEWTVQLKENFLVGISIHSTE